jgi:hypothetical protein
MKYVRGFFLFWYDFIVGDSIALAIGGVLILALAYVLVHAGAERLAEVLLPLAAIGTIAASLPQLRGR